MSLKTLLGRIWIGWAGLWFISTFIILYPLFFIWLNIPALYRIGHFQRRIWGILTCLPAGLFPMITKETDLPVGRRRVYCINHSSYLDILTAGTFLPGFNFFMAKMELSKVPLFKIWFKSLDIPVQRDKIRSSHKAFVDAGIQFNKGIDMIIFPEGKIPADAPQLGPLKAGAFKLAIEKGALIIPVTLPDNYKRLDSNHWVGSPGRMRIHIHRPIDTTGLNIEDADALKEEVFHILENKLLDFGTIKDTYENYKRKSG